MSESRRGRDSGGLVGRIHRGPLVWRRGRWGRTAGVERRLDSARRCGGWVGLGWVGMGLELQVREGTPVEARDRMLEHTSKGEGEGEGEKKGMMGGGSFRVCREGQKVEKKCTR